MKIFSIIMVCAMMVLGGCGAAVNITNQVRKDVSVFISNDLNIGYASLKDKPIYVQFNNMTGLDLVFAQDIKAKLISSGYKTVEKRDEAEIMLYIDLRSFSSVSKSSLTNVKKYLQYMEIFKNNPNAANMPMGIVDESFTLGDKGQINPKGFTDTVFGTLQSFDVLSGLAIGSVVAFLISGANPAAIAMGAIGGAVITAALQKITEDRNYLATFNVRISKKLNQKVLTKDKIITAHASNVTREIYSDTNQEWVDYQTNIFVLLESFYFKSSAIKQTKRAILEASAAVLQ